MDQIDPCASIGNIINIHLANHAVFFSGVHQKLDTGL